MWIQLQWFSGHAKPNVKLSVKEDKNIKLCKLICQLATLSVCITASRREHLHFEKNPEEKAVSQAKYTKNTFL